MPAATDLRGSEATGVFWIRRAATPAVTRPRRLVRAEDNEESVPSAGWVALWWRRAGPLPKWYRRTPLRDITNIVNAVENERRRLRMQAAARAARVRRDTESSPEGSTQEPSVIGRNNRIDPTPNLKDASDKNNLKKKKKKKNAKDASDKKRVVQRKTLMSMR